MVSRCTSVVERYYLGNCSLYGSNAKDRLLQPLNVHNLDRAELLYVASVNGFLRDSPFLCALLDRQLDIGAGNTDLDAFEDEEKKDEMGGIVFGGSQHQYGSYYPASPCRDHHGICQHEPEQPQLLEFRYGVGR